MSDFRIDKITNRDGSAGTQIAGITTFSGTSGMQLPSGPTEYRGGRGRGVKSGSKPATTSMEYIEIATTGNATDFGDVFDGGYGMGSAGSYTRGVTVGGYSLQKSMGYFTFSSKGGQSEFGDLNKNQYLCFGLSNGIRGLFGGAYYKVDYNAPFEPSDAYGIDEITFATKGNASDWGDNVQVPTYCSGSVNSSTRGIYGGGRQRYPNSIGGGNPNTPNNTPVENIVYLEFASRGETAQFGSLGFAGAYTVGGSSPTRGIFMGGEAPSIQNRIDYITIATTGDATDFGDLTQTTTRHAGTSSHTRGISMGGTNPSASNVISYVTISTTGNATDFGDLSSAEKWFSACSDVHGGLE